MDNEEKLRQNGADKSDANTLPDDTPSPEDYDFVDEDAESPSQSVGVSVEAAADISADAKTDEKGGASKHAKPRSRFSPKAVWENPRVVRYRYLGLSFLVPALTMWLIYIALGTYPFGESSVLVLDLNGQYVYFFEQLRNIVLGDGSFLYSFGRALGGEFMGIYAYYLASPFSFIVCLFPKSMITEALLVMFLLKTGLCGLTFGIYLDYHTEKFKLNKTAIVMFSTVYALTAYAVVQQHNTMWIDNLIMMPMIVLGIERLIRYRRFRLFVITLTFAVMSNFYIGYMMCIFVFFYFFIAYATIPAEERNMKGESHHFIKSLARIGGCAALVLSMSCVILWSAYYSLTFGKTTFSNPDYTFTSKFDLFDLVSKLFIGSYDTVRPEGLPFVYCGTLVLILLPIYFLIKRIPMAEKVRVMVMSAFFIFSFTGSTIDLVWHGFQRPNWLNYRYSFMLCFFMIFAAYRAFCYISEVDVRAIAAVGAFWMLILVLLQKVEAYEWVSDYKTVWLSLLFVVAFVVLLRYHILSDVPGGISLALASIVVLESFVGGLLNLIALDEDVVISSRPSYRTFIDRVQPVVDRIEEQDDSFYRMEKTFHRKTNDALSLGFYGLSNSTSTLNKDTILFLNQLGLSSKSHWSKYLGGTPVLDSLLGLKYLMIEQGSDISPLYQYMFAYDHVENDANPAILAYQNPYALSLAYGVSPDVLNFSTMTDDTPFLRMNGLVGAMLGRDGYAEIFKPIPIDDEMYSYCTKSYTTGHDAYTSDSSDLKGRVTYKITAQTDGNIYCYFPSDYTRESDLYLNGTKLCTYYGNETYRVVDLGYHVKGESVTVEIRMTEYDKLYIMSQDTYFYYIDEAEFKSAMEELHTSEFKIDKYNEDTFKGTIDIAAGDEFVFTSIPYDEGWVVKVDGERADLVKTISIESETDPETGETVVSYAVLGFYADPGEHTLSIEYRPACIVYGRLVSLGGLVAFIAVCAVDYMKRRRSLPVKEEIS